jgi:hypothetical protein
MTRPGYVAQRHVADAGEEVDVEHVGVALLRALREGRLDVVGPPLFGRVAQRLGAGVDDVEPAVPPEVGDLGVAALGAATVGVGLGALAALLVAPGHLVDALAAGALSLVDAHWPSPPRGASGA